MPSPENVIIIGSGPAGYTAALYAARAELEPLVSRASPGAGCSSRRPTSRISPAIRHGVAGPEMMRSCAIRPSASARGS